MRLMIKGMEMIHQLEMKPKRVVMMKSLLNLEPNRNTKASILQLPTYISMSRLLHFISSRLVLSHLISSHLIKCRISAVDLYHAFQGSHEDWIAIHRQTHPQVVAFLQQHQSKSSSKPKRRHQAKS